MCVRCLEECREKGEGAGVPEVKEGRQNHEKTRMDTNVILPWTGYAVCQHVSGLWIFVYFVVQGFNSHLLRLHFEKRRSPPVAILLIRVASRLVRGVLRRRLGHPACGPLA